MQRHELQKLRERLLRAGIRPRHVRRYIRELREHYDDAVQAELDKGLARVAAQQQASVRMGSEEELFRSVLGRPELYSVAARFPAVVFGVGPVFTWLGIVSATVLAVHLLPQVSTPQAEGQRWLLHGGYALCVAYLRLLPVLLGMVALHAAAERRLPAFWPLAGSALVDLAAGTMSIQLVASAGQLGVSSSFLPLLASSSALWDQTDLRAFNEGLLRAACMLAISFAAQRAWRRARFTAKARA